jgi:hypothetical protein
LGHDSGSGHGHAGGLGKRAASERPPSAAYHAQHEGGVEASMPVNNVSAVVWLAPARQSRTRGAAGDLAVRG